MNWFKSHLTNRKQFTFVNGVYSQAPCINCGVPKGSVLGPLLLFLIYVDNTKNAFQNATPKSFADDINLFLFHKDIKTHYSLANTKLDSLNEWFLTKKLSLSMGHDKDSKYALFSSKKYPDVDTLPKLYIANQVVP